MNRRIRRYYLNDIDQEAEGEDKPVTVEENKRTGSVLEDDSQVKAQDSEDNESDNGLET